MAKVMAEAGDGNFSNAQPKCSPTAITDAPITDPGSTIKVCNFPSIRLLIYTLVHSCQFRMCQVPAA